MFEKSPPISNRFHATENPINPEVGRVESPRQCGDDALRAIEWSELTARLNAARDLRRELRREAILCVGASGAGFGDAAASFFRNLGHGERHINLIDLDGCKAFGGNPSTRSGTAATGDARDGL